MRQFLKRAGALALSLLLLLGGSSLGMVVPAKAAGNADRLDPAAAQAYAKVLQDIVSQRGICNAAAGSDGFVSGGDGMSFSNDQLGLAYAELIDFDGKGTPELYLYYTCHEADRDQDDERFNYILREELWYWNGSSASRAHSEDYTAAYGGGISESRYLYPAGGKTYLASTSEYLHQGMCGESQTIQQFSNGTLTDYQSISESWDNNLFFSDDILYSLFINGSQIYQNIPTDYSPIEGAEGWSSTEAKEFYQKYSLSGAKELIRVYEWMVPDWKTNNVSALLSQLQTRSTSGAAGTDALNNIAYIGDPGRCKMDAKMANAYADAIEKLPKTVTTEWGNQGTLYAALADFADDGLPILITAYLNKSSDYWSMESCENVRFGYIIDGPIFWGCKNGAAYNAGVQRLNYGNGYGKLDGKGMIFINEFFHDVGHERNSWYYTISHGQIELTRTITEYDAYEYQSGIATCDGAPAGASYVLSEYELDASKLAQNGWVKVGNEYWRLILDNGKNITQQFLNMEYVNGEYARDGKEVLLGSGFKVEGALAHISDAENHINFDTTPASSAASMLRAYAEGQSAYPSFTKVTEDDDPYVRDVIKAIADALGGEIAGVYKLTDGVYYVIAVIDGAEQGALVRGVRENGKITWKVVQKDASPLEEDVLEQLASDLLSRSNMALDYNRIPGFSSFRDILDYLQDRLDNMDGISANDAAKTDLAAFIETSIAGLFSGSVSGKDNRLTVDSSTPGDLASQAQSAWRDIESMLGKNDVTLNKDIVIIIRVLWQDLDWSEPCQLTLDASLLDALNGCTVQLLLADGRHYVQLSADHLKTLVDRYGSLGVQLSKAGENTYAVNFLDGEDKIIDQLPAAVTVGLPADSMTSTIMASYSGGSDNWGGQYDPSARVISFDVRYSGQYEVLENNVQIDDIGGLPEESQAAIRFLVSKGFLGLAGNRFDPSGSLTRYQFTQALVGMFFALDRGLATNFEDVPASSEYYPYVASAEARSIVEGYDETTFGGDNNMTVEQMLAVAARTLRDQKGYTFPTDVEQYLSSFTDWEEIDDWALQQVALTVRENIVDRGGALMPQADITREQAAVILYRLFLLLYEVPPVALDLPPVTETEASSGGISPVVIAAAAGGAVIAGGGVGTALYFLAKKKSVV